MADTLRLEPVQRAFAAAARRATLATIRPDGAPRLVPICFVLVTADPADPAARDRLYSPIDEKPKASPDPRRLARVRDVAARPDVGLLIDRWSEDWTQLAWLRLAADAVLLEPDGPDRSEHDAAVAALRAKYPQYAAHGLEDRPMLRFSVSGATSWGDLELPHDDRPGAGDRSR